MNTTLSIEAIPSGANLYNIVQQEVDLGAKALQRGEAGMAVTFFQSALEKLSVDQPFYDHLVHNLLLSYKLLIEQLFEGGGAASASGLLRSVMNLEIAGEMSNDSEFLKRFAEAYQELGLVYSRHKHFDASLVCCRKSLSIHRAPGFHINLSNALTMSGQRAILSDFTTEIESEQLGRHIFIACVPKSGSTFLKNVLVALSGYRDAFMVSTPSQFEQELYLPVVENVAHLDTVTQQHCRASAVNVQMMQAFGIRPVVLVRNIFDSVMSLLDFYDKGAFLHSYFRADYQLLDRETRIDLIIDNFVPWYFQFVTSWRKAEKDRSLEIFWISYEELIQDKVTTIQKLLEFYGLGAAKRGIEQTIKRTESEKRKSRFNKGVTGRGNEGLSEAQKEKIRRMARYFPGTDFSCLGL
jgi:tetratricopeptide (TPR) repeat protein